MTELEHILRLHAARYPAMEPTDAVKLIYQNEFGGGHLIADRQAFFAYLHREFSQIAPNPAIAVYEEIGNGLVRVNLAALAEDELTPLGNAFILSAAKHRGNMDSFLGKLETLKQLTLAGIFSFDSAKLAEYLAEYEKAGYPAVSHSQAYRDAYHPAYRIILKERLPQEYCE